jgi:Domain of unknown function (DUF222)
VRAAFAAGRLSYSKVRALSRVENVEREDTLLMLAEHATAAQLERLVRAYRGVVTAERTATGRPHRYVTWQHADDGSLLLHARLPAEEGEVVLAALEAGADRLREAAPSERPAPPLRASAEALVAPHDGSVLSDGTALGAQAVPHVSSSLADGAAPEAQMAPHDSRALRDRASAEAQPRSPTDADADSVPTTSELRADALLLMAGTLLSHGPDARAGDRYQVVLHVDADALARGSDGGRCELADGAPVAAETARRLACDAAIVPLVERGGKPLSVGRKTRAVPAALRRALASRDRGCRFPGCTNRCSVDAHHLRHWAHGGPTSLDNLVQVCRYHHRLLHEGGYTVESSGAGFRFRRPDGRQLHAVPRPPKGRAGALRDWARSVHPDACVPKSGGEPMDLALCVDAMLSAAPAEAPGI